eukprot:gnl/TRDRNA2_/TRDRNA2_152221_c1_seq1.p1 gnl/TRDRNA2_/TRDRNA2_152221_c1~~gnl/TRDRNA2_/TRDRNA2_152221_c1_seq1.p1  ORF type:complete len:248 (+),score=42.98 gnl/TRDRNA2_/TRDRNA2_152221_c1_seq1:78-821(+)
MADCLNQAEFFCRQMEDPANKVCCDGTATAPLWASVSHGIYLGINAAGVHRSLGVKVSFVQSIDMDVLRPVHLRMMELGGNRRFFDFLKQHRIPEDMPIREKYSTRAAKWYREDLKARAHGLEPLEPLPPGTGHLPAEEETASYENAVLDHVYSGAPQTIKPGATALRHSPRKVEANAGACRKFCDCLKIALGVPVSPKHYQQCFDDWECETHAWNLQSVSGPFTEHLKPRETLECGCGSANCNCAL